MQGIHTAMVTPFTAEGRLDLDAYRSLCHRQIVAGVHGLVACGTTGETPTLALSEQHAVLTATLDVASGSVPVTMGVGTNDTRTSVQRTEAAAEAGAAAGLLVFPYYNKPNPRGVHAHVNACADVGLPLVLYHVPGRTGQRLPPQLVAELSQIEGVIAVKEATGDLNYGGELLGITETAILSGDDFTFLPLLALGGSGCISVVSNVAPARTVKIFEDFMADRNQAAAETMHDLLPVVRFLFSDTNPTPCKAILEAMGFCGRHTRLPLASFEGDVPAELLAGLS
jgi:4-hydroxy-tetrahydrodipicolinate synthase